MFSMDELPKRAGVELMDLAGVGASWPMPVALWDAPKGFDTRLHPDHQPCHVIALRLTGSLVQRVGPTTVRPERLRPDGFSVHPANVELRFMAPSAIRFAHLYLPDAFVSQVSGMASAGDPGGLIRTERVMYEDREITEAIGWYVRRAFERDDHPSRFEMESRANLIVLRLLQRHWRQRPAVPPSAGSEMAPWQVRKICTHLEGNLDRPVGLDELSSLVGLSGEHLCRAFRRAIGVPPLKWQLLKRMEVAGRLLIETDASLTSIAQDVGYSGQSAFGSAFRSVFGMSPGQYRRTRRSAR